MQDKFTTFDIIKKLGIPRGRLREWMNEGFIVPSVQKAEGVGTKALFDRVDILAIVIFKHLIESHKISRNEAAEITKDWALAVHLFKKGFNEEHFQNFLANYTHFHIIQEKGKLIVGLIVIHYLLMLFDIKDAGRINDVFGEANCTNALRTGNLMFDVLHGHDRPLMREAIKSGKYKVDDNVKKKMDEPLMDYDSVLQINFRKILEEAKKVFD